MLLLSRHYLRDIIVVLSVIINVQIIRYQTEDKRMKQFGHILFLLGIIFAFVAGIGFEHPWLPLGLAIFGIFVGLVNVVDEDTNKFLITGIALEVSASAFREFSFMGAAMSDVMIFVGGALLVVAMRVLFATALSTLWKSEK